MEAVRRNADLGQEAHKKPVVPPLLVAAPALVSNQPQVISGLAELAAVVLEAEGGIMVELAVVTREVAGPATAAAISWKTSKEIQGVLVTAF